MNGKLQRAARLFWIFLKIGAFTFGGGYAMIPLIERETVEKRGLLDREELTDIVAIAESTPGPIAVNAATFVGFRAAGVPGALFATVGVVLPSFLIILAVAFFLRRVTDNRYVRYAFFGIRAGVLALIVRAAVDFFRSAEHNVFSFCVMAAAFIWSAVLDWSVIALIALCGLAGLVFCTVKRKRERR